MRDVLLQAKALEIQSMLEVWARENGILVAGERMVFSVRIDGVPTVVIEKYQSTEDLRNLPVMEFFTRERFIALGVPKGVAKTLVGAIRRVATRYDPTIEGRVETIKDMAEFLKIYGVDYSREDIDYIGKKRKEFFLKALEVFR